MPNANKGLTITEIWHFMVCFFCFYISRPSVFFLFVFTLFYIVTVHFHLQPVALFQTIACVSCTSYHIKEIFDVLNMTDSNGVFTLAETETESDKHYLEYNCVKVFILLRDRDRVRYKFAVGFARISSVSVSVSVSVNEPLAMQHSVAYTDKLP